MADKIFAPLAIIGLVLTVGYLAVKVNEWNLWIIIVAVVIMVCIDFVMTIREGGDQQYDSGEAGRDEPGGGAGPI